MSYSKEKFASRLRDLRTDHDLSQQKIAEMLHCDRSTYTYYEIGKYEPPFASLSRLAEFYQTSVDYLLNLTDITEPYPRSKKK